METNQLLLHLIKKLENKELYLVEDKDYFYLGNDEGEDIVLGKKDKIGYVEGCLKWDDYNPDWNNEFKEKFYKSKGIKCWVKDCQNKILEKDGDHKKVRVQCQDKHTRMVCNECNIKISDVQKT